VPTNIAGSICLAKFIPRNQEVDSGRWDDGNLAPGAYEGVKGYVEVA
jgi:hypothetical protein